jgi:hypothetical protein
MVMVIAGLDDWRKMARVAHRGCTGMAWEC